MYRSPDGEPLSPASPSPESLILVPSSTPGGIVTDKVFSFRTRPDPEQDLQAIFITCPLPWHVGHVRSIVKKPC